MLLAVVVAIAAGIWLRWDAIHFGYHSDDHVQIGMLRGEFPAPRGAFDLFRLADVPRDGRRAIDQGYLPWWTHEGLKLALFRPLSSNGSLCLALSVDRRDAHLAALTMRLRDFAEQRGAELAMWVEKIGPIRSSDPQSLILL